MLGGVPDLRVAVEHVASPHDPSPGGMKIWETGLASLADLPGVNVKVSALQWLDPSQTDASLGPYLDPVTGVLS